MKIIGMVHLEALPGYPQFKGMQQVVSKAVKDAIALEQGGVDAILVENTEDDPHRKNVGEETISAMTFAIQKIKETVKVPLGICVLWNDYKAGIGIAKVLDLQFVRIPVFTEAVLTSAGLIEGNPYDVISYRNNICANNVKILADVQVKHATVLSKQAIGQSAKEALHFGADELIVTGKFTGNAPEIEKVKEVRESCPNAVINIGSGTTPDNIIELSKYADNFIVGTYFKNADGSIDIQKVKALVQKAKFKKNAQSL